MGCLSPSRVGRVKEQGVTPHVVSELSNVRKTSFWEKKERCRGYWELKPKQHEQGP